MTVIRDGDIEMLVDTTTGEVLQTRTAEDALCAPLWDKQETDPMVLGHWLIGLSKGAARVLLAIAEKTVRGNHIADDVTHRAQDILGSPQAASRALRELRDTGCIKGGGITASLNPTIAYTAPYGLKSYWRDYDVQLWYM